MGKMTVTFEELVDLAIGTPETTVNFSILHKVLKLLGRYCCKMDYTFEIDKDNMKSDVKAISKRSRSPVSESRSICGSSSDSGQTEVASEKDVKIKMERNVDREYDDGKAHIKTEKYSQEFLTEQKVYDSSSDVPKQSEIANERQKGSEVDDRITTLDKDESVKDKSKKEKDKEKKKKKKKESDDDLKKDESKRKSSEKHKKVSSNEDVKKADAKNRMNALEDFNKHSENRTNELESRLKDLADRIESVTQTIATHLNEEHLATINEEIEKLKKSMENANDQCYEASNTINDQASQIQDILTTINTIQLRKVENEELIDLLSGKADHSFVDEKVSITQFDEMVQELKDAMNESSAQFELVRDETNTLLDEIKEDLDTKLLAEEFDTAKTKIYKELIKLTEQQDLILAQQNEHVAAGAKMRNLNCFVCDSNVVMLLEQETIPKFRPLKVSRQPLEPVIGSKIFISKNAPEWKNHQLKAKDYTRTSKSSRFNSYVNYEKASYVKGKNGCMYKGKVGCDCIEAFNDIARRNRSRCCDMVQENNKKNISLTNRMNSDPKCVDRNGNGDVTDACAKTLQRISTDHLEEKSNVKTEDDTQPTTEKIVEIETTFETSEQAQTVNIFDESDKIKIELDPLRTETDIAATVPNRTVETTENLSNENENEVTATNADIPVEANNATQDTEASNQ